jgi:hypothetical protein
MAPDEADKENVDNGGKPSRSKRSDKNTTKTVVDDNLDVFDPENDKQFQEATEKANKTQGKSKTSKKGGESSEREKELSKLKVCLMHHVSKLLTSLLDFT